MPGGIEELKRALERASLEEQKELLEEFMVASTDRSVLDLIHIANESDFTDTPVYIISSHIKE
jgi:hypothetical protein